MSAREPHNLSGSDAEPSRRQSLERRLRDRHTDRDAYLELAAIYRSENRPLQAAKILQKGHEVFSDDAAILWEWEEARLARSLQTLSEVSAMAAKTNSPIADKELDRSQTDWAACRIQICRARIARDDSRQYLRLVLGEALYDLARYEEAIEELAPLADHDQHGSSASLWMGRCHLVSGRDVEAMKWLRNACLRRAVASPLKVRLAALKLLIDLADRQGLAATLDHYRSVLASIQETDANAKAVS